ncbi:MAG: ribosome-associated translation inhibitor RaiA [Actinomycetota bacterium]|nr:MAG: ribosome-associated translation inhibitor RaiA [Actinomycetota bacterium]
MEYIVKTRNFELNEKIRDYSEKKIKDKIEKLLDRMTKTEVKFVMEKNPRISENNRVEVTAFASGAVIRVTDTGTDIFEAIDKVSSKLERQIKKYRDKMTRKGRKNHKNALDITSAEIGKMGSADSGDIEEKIRESIVKTKSFVLKPISPEEAVIQMEMLGHDFFVFINSETERTAVIYKRKDSNYGLIEPTI